MGNEFDLTAGESFEEFSGAPFTGGWIPRRYALSVTTPGPSGSPTPNPTDEKVKAVPWWRLTTMQLVLAGMFSFGFCAASYGSVRCFHEYKHDAGKIYAEAPVYKKAAHAFATEAIGDLYATPSYVKATSKEWVQMIVQPNKLDARDWPARVGSEVRCVTDGHL